jgi:lipid II:glycine glycyltransferase (peptidoglycan interpeptide bridge formation enzyme)
MHVKVLTPSREEEWDKYLLGNKHADFLQSFYWAQLLIAAYDFKPVFLEIKDADTPVAYMLFHEGFSYHLGHRITYRLLGPLRRFFTKYIIANGGPIILDDNKTDEILTSILAWLREYSSQNHIRSIKLTPFYYNDAYANNPSIEETFKNFGYAATKWATYLVDLNQDEESLWHYIKHSARKSLNQVMKTNLAVKKIEGYNEYIEKFFLPYNRIEKEFGRAGLPLWYARKIKDYLPNKYYHYFYAKINGNIVGVLGMYVYNQYASEIMSATSRYAYANKIYAQDLLHWEMFKFAKKLGCHTFNLVGVNPDPQTDKEKGIRQFKEKWGGKYIEYFIYDLDFGGNALFNTLKKAYQIFEYLLSKL